MEDVIFLRVNFDTNSPDNDVFPAVSDASLEANNLEKNLSWGIYFITPFMANNELGINATIGEVLILYKLRSTDGSTPSNYTYYGKINSGYTESSLKSFALTAFRNLGGIILPSTGSGSKLGFILGGILLLTVFLTRRKEENPMDEQE